MKQLIFSATTLILILTAVTVLGQDYKDYPLQDYYTPDIKRRSLEFGLYGKFDAEKEDKHLLKIDQSSTFLSHTNTREKISILYINSALSEKNARQMDDYLKYQSFRGILGVGYDERRYMTPKLFLQYGAFGSGIISPLKETRPEFSEETGYIEVEYKDRAHSLGGNLQAGIGIGRIENVTDARQALYILEELSKNGRLNNHLSDDEIFRFAQLISSVKNKRFLDARLHRIEEISRVDSFLVSGDYLTIPDATYFTTLYDLWLYGDLFERKSGKEFFINSTVQQYFYRNAITMDGIRQDPHKSGATNTHITAAFLYEKPVRLSWQHSVETSLSYSYRKENDGKFMMHSIPLPVKYSLGYYPNTRTHLQLSIEERLQRDILKQKTNIADTQYKTKQKILQSNSTLSLDAYYYVSPHLLFSATAATYLNFSKYKLLEKQLDDPRSDEMFALGNYSSWNTNIEFKVTYKLF